MIEDALDDFRGSGVNVIVSIQASAGPNSASKEGGFATRWIELAQQTKTPSAVLVDMKALGCGPSFFTTVATPLAPPHGFHLVGTRLDLKDKKVQTQVAASHKDALMYTAMDDLPNVSP